VSTCEIHRQDGLGLRGEELSPGRTRSARCGIDAGVMQDLPHGRGGDVMVKPDQLALYSPMPPREVLICHPHHQLLDRLSGRGKPGLAACGVVPLARDQLAVPDQDRGRSHREDLDPAATRQQPG